MWSNYFFKISDSAIVGKITIFNTISIMSDMFLCKIKLKNVNDYLCEFCTL